MMSSDTDKRNFVHLLMLASDLAEEVVRGYIEVKILPKYDSSFPHYLGFHKHEIFHSCFPKKQCCQCSEIGIANAEIQRYEGTKKEAIFTKLYVKIGSKFCHKSQQGMEMNCICRVAAKADLRLEDVEFSLLNSIISSTVKINKKDMNAIQSIQQQRFGMIKYMTGLKCPDEEFSKIWKSLEKAVLGLANENFTGLLRRMTEKQLKLIQIADADMVNMEEMLQKMRVDMRFAHMLMAWKNGMNGFSKELIEDAIVVFEDNEYSKDKVTFKEVIRQLTLNIEHTALPRLVNGFMIKAGPHFSKYRLDTPKTWDNRRYVNILNSNNPEMKETEKNFKIISASVGSLVIKTTTNPELLQDPEKFQNAVRGFLTKLVEVCEIDTSIPTTVPVQISISGAGPFEGNNNDMDTATTTTASGGAMGGVRNDDVDDMFSDPKCDECQIKQDEIDRLTAELAERDAYIAKLEKQIQDMKNKGFQPDLDEDMD